MLTVKELRLDLNKSIADSLDAEGVKKRCL